MTRSQENIVKRWELMASKDLGYEVRPVTIGFAKIFREVFENDFSDGNIQVHGDRYANRYIRGFALREGGCNVVECCDLNHIDFDSIQDVEWLDWWLMNRMGWFDRYKYALSMKEPDELSEKKKKGRMKEYEVRKPGGELLEKILAVHITSACKKYIKTLNRGADYVKETENRAYVNYRENGSVLGDFIITES